jgi:hypothetical protein
LEEEGIRNQMARTAESSLVVSTVESRFIAEDYDFWNRLEYIYVLYMYQRCQLVKTSSTDKGMGCPVYGKQRHLTF